MSTSPKQRLSRRQFLQGSASAAALLGLGLKPSFGSLATGAAAQAEKITLSVLAADWGGDYNALLSRIGKTFTEANPNIEVSWDFPDDPHTKLLTLIAGKTPPDLAITYQPNTLARLGALMPLDDKLKAAGITRANYPAPEYDQAVYEGKLYALPGGSDYIVMVYSKDMYREAGLDPNKPPKTTDEFMANNLKILKKDASGNVTKLGYLPVKGHMLYWSYIFGGKWYDPATQKITANDPGNVAAFEWIGNYVAKIGYDQWQAYSAIPGVFEPGNPFSTGQLAHFFEGFWIYDPLDKHAPKVDYGMALLPTLKGTPEERANYSVGGWLFGIPAGAKYADAAWQFMKFAFIDNAAKMGVDTENEPAYRPAVADWQKGLRGKLGETNRMIPYLGLFSEMAENATKAWPAIPVSAYLANERDRAFEAVISGGKSAKDALDEMTKNAQAELDKALKK